MSANKDVIDAAVQEVTATLLNRSNMSVAEMQELYKLGCISIECMVDFVLDEGVQEAVKKCTWT